MYPPELVKPMRDELENAGFSSLLTTQDVEQALQKEGTTLVVVNSVCGCAAGTARPGAVVSLQFDKTTNIVISTFYSHFLV